jgi:UDP:flavonoid glycosyltransferase YjiC (YdhE family)
VLSKVLLCPLASPGFAFAAIAVGRELRARGHEVALTTSPWLVPLVRGEGIPAVADDDGGHFETSRWHDPAAIVGQARAVERALEAFAADVLVTTALALGPLIAAERAGLPVAVIGLMTPLLASGSRTRRVELQAALDRGRAAAGLPPVAIDRLLGDCHLTRGIPELVDGPHPVGACAWEPRTPEVVSGWLAAARADGRRVLLVHEARGFGAPGFLAALWAALPADMVVAASTSRMDRPLVAPDGALVGPIVPHGAIAQQAVAVVCSGTTAVALAALEHGVPLVVVPAGGEQPDVARLVERAGLGVTVPSAAATPARLGTALDRALALDPAPRLAIQRAFAAYGGTARAAAWIAEL